MKPHTEDYEPLPNGMFRLVTIYKIRYVLTGFLWLVYGVVNLFDDSSMPLKVFSSILMFLAVGCILLSFILKQEPEDDFSERHLGKASQYVLSGAVFIIMIFSMVSAFVPVTLDVSVVYPFLIGGIMLAVGMIWLRLERVAFF